MSAGLEAAAAAALAAAAAAAIVESLSQRHRPVLSAAARTDIRAEITSEGTAESDARPHGDAGVASHSQPDPAKFQAPNAGNAGGNGGRVGDGGGSGRAATTTERRDRGGAGAGPAGGDGGRKKAGGGTQAGYRRPECTQLTARLHELHTADAILSAWDGNEHNLDATGAASFLSSLARVAGRRGKNPGPDPRFQRLLGASRRLFPTFNAGNFAVTLFSLSKMRAKPADPTWFRRYWDAAALVVPEMSSKNISMMVYGAGQLRENPSPDFLRALWEDLDKLAEFEPQGAAGLSVYLPFSPENALPRCASFASPAHID